MYRTHSIVNWLLTVFCICCLNVAQAHTIISSSYPEDNQVLPLITQDATLNFVAPVVILKIELLGELIREDLDISNNAGASKTHLNKKTNRTKKYSYQTRLKSVRTNSVK